MYVIVRRVHGRLNVECILCKIYYHESMWFVLTYEIEIIDAMSFSYHNLIKCRMHFMQNLLP
jgi:hypothetical protein